MIFLSFFLETWKKKKKGRDTELFLQWFSRILSKVLITIDDWKNEIV